jgi:multiple antibiotic resistance protein
VAVTIGSRKPDDQYHFPEFASHAIGALIGLVAIGISIYVAYRFAERIARVLGATGIDVLVRLSAFILMCIGIEIVWTGFTALIATLPHT